MENNNFKYMVCINCHTYNQSNYICDTLNGFTMQKTDFPFIIMLVDDASTDDEQKVIADYVQKHFEIDIHATKETDYALIQSSRHKTNKNCFIIIHYLKYNHYQIGKAKDPYLSKWRNKSKYEAFCEGDDYWIDFLKLQKQIDFLENNPNYVMSYTNGFIDCSEISNKIKRRIKSPSGELSKYLITKGNPIITASACLRMDVSDSFKEERKQYEIEMRMGDLPLWIHASTKGFIHYLNEECVAYRVLSNSASHYSNPIATRTFVDNIRDIQLYLNRYYKLYYPENTIKISHYKRLLVQMSKHAKIILLKTMIECLFNCPLSLVDKKVWYCIIKCLTK